MDFHRNYLSTQHQQNTSDRNAFDAGFVSLYRKPLGCELASDIVERTMKRSDAARQCVVGHPGDAVRIEVTGEPGAMSVVLQVPALALTITFAPRPTLTRLKFPDAEVRLSEVELTVSVADSAVKAQSRIHSAAGEINLMRLRVG
jgi:hypothetical protein